MVNPEAFEMQSVNSIGEVGLKHIVPDLHNHTGISKRRHNMFA